MCRKSVSDSKSPPPPRYCTDDNGQNGALVKSVLLLFHNCRPINLGGKTWASSCVFSGGVIILNGIKQSTPEQTVFTEMSIFRGGLFIYPRPAWTRFAQEPKLKNASPACQGGGLTVGGSLNRAVPCRHLLLPRLKTRPSLTSCRFPPQSASAHQSF